MGKNKKEHFIFVLMICSSMVYLMSCYNIALMEGFSLGVFKIALLHFLPAFLFALVGDIFIIGNIVKIIVPKIVKENDSFKKRVICISLCTACGMILYMSFYGAVTNVGFGPKLLPAYGMGILKNCIVAIPLNLLVVGPIVRALFFKMFPAQN